VPTRLVLAVFGMMKRLKRGPATGSGDLTDNRPGPPISSAPFKFNESAVAAIRRRWASGPNERV
jgi:hypothetical protein